MKKLVIYVILIPVIIIAVWALHSCNTEIKIGDVQETPEIVYSLATPLPRYNGMDFAVVEEGEGITQVIEKGCGCNLNSFFNLGVIWTDASGNQKAYIEDKRALNFIGVLSQFFVTQKGDRIYWGKRATAEQWADPNTVWVSAFYDNNVETVVFYGGQINKPITGKLYRNMQDSKWEFFVEEQPVPSQEDALTLSMY